jgi:hypothetical protein
MAVPVRVSHAAVSCLACLLPASLRITGKAFWAIIAAAISSGLSVAALADIDGSRCDNTWMMLVATLANLLVTGVGTHLATLRGLHSLLASSYKTHCTPLRYMQFLNQLRS